MNNNEKIEKYIRKNGPSVINKGIKEIAISIDVSPAALTRYCQFKGYRGFTDLNSIIQLFNVNNSNYDKLIMSIKKTTENIDKRKIKYIADKITEAKNIFILGESFTFLQGSILERKLARININAKVINVASDLSLILPKENSIYIFISHSGKNPNIRSAGKKISSNIKEKMFIFSVTPSKVDSISSICNDSIHGHLIESDKVGRELNSNAIIITQIILDEIYSCVFNNNIDHNKKILESISSIKLK